MEAGAPIRPVDRSEPAGGRDNPRLSSHILPAAGTMVGVCTTLIGLVKIAEAAGSPPSMVDQCYGLAALVFLASAFTSYLSMRADTQIRRATWLERLADWCFMAGLTALAAISLLFAWETI